MLGWSRWINYLDPVAYGFEALIANEFHNRRFHCDQLSPGYGALANNVCAVKGAVAGQDFVEGDAFINLSYDYYNSHKWRNFGILWVFLIGLAICYLIAAELVSSKKSKGEILVCYPNRILSKCTDPDLDFPPRAHSCSTDQEHTRRHRSRRHTREDSRRT